MSSRQEVDFISLSDAANRLLESDPLTDEHFAPRHAELFRAADAAAKGAGAPEAWEDAKDPRWLGAPDAWEDIKDPRWLALPEVQALDGLVEERLASERAGLSAYFFAMNEIIRAGAANKIDIYGCSTPRTNDGRHPPQKIDPIALTSLKPDGSGQSTLMVPKDGDPNAEDGNRVWYDVRVDRFQIDTLRGASAVQTAALNLGANTQRPYLTGLRGRPSSLPLVLREADRRIEAGEVPESKEALAEELAIWKQTEHPNAPPITRKTIANKLTEKFNAYLARPK